MRSEPSKHPSKQVTEARATAQRAKLNAQAAAQHHAGKRPLEAKPSSPSEHFTPLADHLGKLRSTQEMALKDDPNRRAEPLPTWDC